MVNLLSTVASLASLASVVAATDSIASVAPKDLQVTSKLSILGVAKTLAGGVMSYYPGNASSFADLPKPYYWWECGALLGAMLDYSYYTNDSTYDDIIATALMANVGPAYDFMVPEHRLDEGNDDQAFWAFAALSAAEHAFEQPAGMPTWTAISVNVWESMAARWNSSTCNGGLSWQIFAENFNGLNYKNSASNGGFFHISARLALLTGNQTYLDWAGKVWDWTAAIGLIDRDYNIFDGTDSAVNCTTVNPLSFSYQNGIFLLGAAALANLTSSNGDGDGVWSTRAAGLLNASRAFFTPSDNATNIMWEHACEGVGRCTTDMKSFKGYLSRFMYASSVLLPSLAPTVGTYLRTTAAAAGKSCTGGNIDGAPSGNGSTCGQLWYVGGFDAHVGLGQELSALETVHGLLVLDGVVDDVPVSQPSATTTATASATATATATPSPTASQQSGAQSKAPLDMQWTVLGMACALLAVGMP